MSQTRRRLGIISIFVVAAALVGCMALLGAEVRHDAPTVLESKASGGEGTVDDITRDAFSRPLANMPVEKLRQFTFGNKLFNTNWVAAPASVTSLDGLGPIFNRVSCSGCHFKDGRGRPPLNPDEPMNSMLLRLSVPGTAADGGPNPHPAYGLQLNDKAISGVPAEGRAVIRYVELAGGYPDGATYSLRQPDYSLVDMQFGALGEGAMISPRIAPAVFGLGLLEAVSEEDILSRADPADANKDGISGRPSYVYDPINKRKALGRFGLKANVATLELQDAGAIQGDIGITSSVEMQENCPDVQVACKAAISGGQPELSDEQLQKMVFYTQTLAVPARRHVSDPVVKRGAELFAEAQCSSCHTPQMRTGKHTVPELSHQDIQPFTDMLLHDMGQGLADGRPDFEATGSEWRTPPLWGIGLIKTVNRHSFLLHDGRARNAEEAILWHGGEGEAAKERFRQMKAPDRAALLKFLESL